MEEGRMTEIVRRRERLHREKPQVSADQDGLADARIRAAACLLLALAFGCAQSPEALARSSARWREIRRDDVAQVSKGWSAPRRIDELSSPGWEDGAYIAADAKTLYFVYTDIDVFRFPNLKKTGPDRDPEGSCFLGCGHFPRADLFFSTWQGSRWGPAQIHPLTVKKPVGGFVLAGPDRAYFMTGADGGWKADIFYADRGSDGWGPLQRIKNVSSKAVDRDPWVGPKQNELWFSSGRPAPMAKENIWMSRRKGEGWADPVMAPAPINSEAEDMQPFLHGGFVYFSSTRDGSLAIYRSKRSGDRFAPPEKLISSRHGVGEPTLSADGQVLTFVQVFRDGPASTIDLMEIRRESSGLRGD
jgi:hypothetical protein